LFAALTALAVAPGCQSKPQFTFGTVEGTVSKGGKPLPGVVVVFWSESEGGAPVPSSHGPTNSAGHFRLHTDQGVDGAVVGPYRVCVVEASAVLSRMVSRKTSERLPKDLLSAQAPDVPAAYARRTETPLRAVVQPGAQVIDFEVK
jgi:hypothetical protein